MTYSCTNLDTISYTLALIFFEKKVLYVLQSQGQAACLMASLQEKTSYRSTPFATGDGKARNVLQKKTIEEAKIKMVRETAD